MNDEFKKIEARLLNLKNFYLKLDGLISQLPPEIPDNVRNLLKDKILGDKELKELMDGLDNHRPPRFLLIGRTGVGKSSLINALCGAYTAEVSDTVSCTEGTKFYQCMDRGRVLMEILDTRGIAESASLNDTVTAEQQLKDDVCRFSPDVAIFMLNCTHRDSIDKDVEFVNQIVKQYESTNKIPLPVIVVINRTDEVMPSRLKNPAEYSEIKLNNIETIKKYYREIIVRNGLKVLEIIPVSSYIDWKLSDGTEISVEDIKNLPEEEIANLCIAFDGRYNIERLREALDNAILDFRAKMGLRMALRLQDMVHRMAIHLTNIFAMISGTVALSPIPISDIYILLILQAFLVMLISLLSGRDVTLDSAKEFVISLLGINAVGWGLRIVAQQASKLLNIWFPGAGSAVSTLCAAGGTRSIGQAAVAYYIDDKTLEEVKQQYKQNQDEKQ